MNKRGKAAGSSMTPWEFLKMCRFWTF